MVLIGIGNALDTSGLKEKGYALTRANSIHCILYCPEQNAQ
jgi:hypothetical protein